MSSEVKNKAKKEAVKLDAKQQEIADKIHKLQVDQLKSAGITDRALARAMGFSPAVVNEVLPAEKGIAGKTPAGILLHKRLLRDRSTVRYCLNRERADRDIANLVKEIAGTITNAQERAAYLAEQTGIDKPYSDTPLSAIRDYSFTKEPGEVKRAQESEALASLKEQAENTKPEEVK